MHAGKRLEANLESGAKNDGRLGVGGNILLHAAYRGTDAI
jgi:hypothetical protein